MAQNILCKWENQEEIRPLAAVYRKQFDQLTSEVQAVNLRKLLGIEFLNDILKNQNNYSDLLNGCDFSINGYNYNQQGLIVFLAHLNASEYQIRGKIHETAAGLVQKSNQDFEQVSLSAQKQIKAEMMEYAMTFWTEIERYLIENITTFPLYRLNSQPNGVYSPEIFVIK